MLKVHHLENSRSQRVLWLLEELGLDYQLQIYPRDPKTMLAPPELRKIHPLGKSPLLDDDGRIQAESGAIIEYLVETYDHGQLWPAPGTPERQRARYWLHYAEGSLMPLLLLKLVFNQIKSAPAPWFARPIIARVDGQTRNRFIDPQLKLHLDYLEAELQAAPWFAGEHFSVADIQLSFPLEAAAQRGGLGAERPRLQAFLERIHQRPAYQRALAKGGRYDYA